MASKRELLLQAFVAALDGDGKPDGVTIHRRRWRPFEKDDLDAICVYLADPPLGGDTERVRRLDHDPGVERTVNIVCQFRVEGEEPDLAIDPLYVWTVRAVMNDPEISALVQDIQEVRGRDFDAADLGGPVGAGSVHFEAELITSETDPSEEALY